MEITISGLLKLLTVPNLDIVQSLDELVFNPGLTAIAPEGKTVIRNIFPPGRFYRTLLDLSYR